MLVEGHLDPREVGHQLLMGLDPVGLVPGLAAVGIPVPEHIDIGKVVLGFPGRGIYRQVDPGLINARLGAEDAVAEAAEGFLVVQGEILLGGLVDDVLAHEVDLGRLIQQGNGLDDFIDVLDRIGKTVPGDARDADVQIDAWPTQRLGGDDLEAVHLAVGLPERPGAQQMQHLPHLLAIGAHDVRGQPDHAHGFGIALLFPQVTRHQGLTKTLANAAGSQGRDARGIHVVEVAPRGQDVVTAPGEIAGWAGRHMSAGHGRKQNIDFL